MQLPLWTFHAYSCVAEKTSEVPVEQASLAQVPPERIGHGPLWLTWRADLGAESVMQLPTFALCQQRMIFTNCFLLMPFQSS